MDTTGLYSAKAEKYARYRWDYACQAIQTIFEASQISGEAVVADIGAGTGILSRHFIGNVARIFAVEPNPAMREMVVKALERYPVFQAVGGSAEATTLTAGSIDLIMVGQAVVGEDPQL